MPPTSICAHQTIATAMKPRPVASTGLKPTRLTTCEATPALMTIVIASGR